MKLLIHSQTSTVVLLYFANINEISSYNACYYLYRLELKLMYVDKGVSVAYED